MNGGKRAPNVDEIFIRHKIILDCCSNGVDGMGWFQYVPANHTIFKEWT